MNRKLLLFLFSLIILPLAGFSQILDPVSWSTDVKKLKDGQVELIIKAKIDKGWHLYAQYLERSDGPIATELTFEKSPELYKLIGKTAEPKPKTEYDPNFDMDLNFFDNSVTFRQKVQVLQEQDFTIKGEVYYMVCDAEKCLPPEYIPLQFKISGVKIPKKTISEEKLITKEEYSDDQKADQISEDSSELAEAEMPDDVDQAELTISDEISDAESNTEKSNRSFWGIFIAGFLGGLLILFTPCVFPMIPLTVTFFTKQSKDRKKGIYNSIIYGLFIIIIYVTLGLLITILMGPAALNAMSTNVWFNLAFFAVFFVFALSFLGAFELTLPSSWINKADQASDKRGILGIFFMAFTLSLVSFSCTAPVIGTLLVETALRGSYLGPAIGMFGFALALALPFALFAAFPAWLNSLPKSGGWLNSVKVVLGFAELALALKFLSNVDLAYHWGILTREVFLALWIVIFGLAGLYLLGKLKFHNDSDLKFISVPRILFAIVFFSFVVYLIPGMFGAPLKLISGFPPPEHYNEGWKLGGAAPAASYEHAAYLEAGAEPEKCPHNLPCFHDYEQGFAFAKKVNKPVMLDFTGHACVNCRKMEDNVWSDPNILKTLRDDYILISLYVDDKRDLPVEEQYISETTGKKVQTIGNKWSDLETRMFHTNTQPLYVLVSPDEKVLSKPTGYTPDIKDYLGFLKTGLKNMKKLEKESQK